MKLPDLKLKKPQLQLKRKPSAGSKPAVKAPKFFTDLYGDLRDRRLLPLIALLIAATIAAPFLLAKDEPEEPTAVASGSSLTSPAAQASFSVAPAAPQLRDYRRRLTHREARNPFAEPAPKPEEQAAGGEDPEGGKAEAAAPSTPTESPVAESGEAPNGGTQTKTDVVVQSKVIGYEIKIKAGYFDRKKPKKQIAAPTKLPNAENPVLVFTGLSKDSKRALFLMSSKVTAYYGKAHCALDKQACQLVELKPGNSATFAYGYGESRYKVTLQKIVPVVATRTTAASVTTKAASANGRGDSAK